jgi:hypothetical protein
MTIKLDNNLEDFLGEIGNIERHQLFDEETASPTTPKEFNELYGAGHMKLLNSFNGDRVLKWDYTRNCARFLDEVARNAYFHGGGINSLEIYQGTEGLVLVLEQEDEWDTEDQNRRFEFFKKVKETFRKQKAKDYSKTEECDTEITVEVPGKGKVTWTYEDFIEFKVHKAIYAQGYGQGSDLIDKQPKVHLTYADRGKKTILLFQDGDISE